MRWSSRKIPERSTEENKIIILKYAMDPLEEKRKVETTGNCFIFTILILKNNCNNYLGGRLRLHESQTYQNCLKQLYLLDKHPFGFVCSTNLKRKGLVPNLTITTYTFRCAQYLGEYFFHNKPSLLLLTIFILPWSWLPWSLPRSSSEYQISLLSSNPWLISSWFYRQSLSLYLGKSKNKLGSVFFFNRCSQAW